MDPLVQVLVLCSSLGALGLLCILWGTLKRFTQLLSSHNELVQVLKTQLALQEAAQQSKANVEADDEETEETFIQPTMLFLNADEIKQLEEEEFESNRDGLESLEWLTSEEFEAHFEDVDEDDIETAEFNYENLPQPVKIKLYRFHNVLENLVENQEQFLTQQHPEAN